MKRLGGGNFNLVSRSAAFNSAPTINISEDRARVQGMQGVACSH